MNKVINILLVEDNDLDRIQVQRTLQKSGILHKLNIVGNGEEALQFLLDEKASENPLPDLILLDLNMPRMSGLEFLAELRTTEELRHSKVFILTTSDQERKLTADMVSGYIVKPFTLKSRSLDTMALTIDLMNMQVDNKL